MDPQLLGPGDLRGRTGTSARAGTGTSACTRTCTRTRTRTGRMCALSRLGAEQALCGRREGDEAGQLLHCQGRFGMERELAAGMDPQLLGTHDMPLSDHAGQEGKIGP